MEFPELNTIGPWINTILITLGILGGGIKWLMEHYRKIQQDACKDKDAVIEEWKDLYETVGKDLEDFKAQMDALKTSIGFCVDGMQRLHKHIGDVKNLVGMIHEDLHALSTKKGRVTKADLDKVTKRSTSKVVALNRDTDD